MAGVLYGGGIVRMSGSIAGNTFGKNKSGQYVRARTKPVNPNSARQIVARSAIKILTARWFTTVSETNRILWADYAKVVVMKNKLGESIYLSGFNHYIRSNAVRAALGLAFVDAGPTIKQLPGQQGAISVAATAPNGLSVSFVNSDDWANEDGGGLVIFEGLSRDITRNYFGGPWRKLVGVAGSGTPPAPSSPATHASQFGAFGAGSLVSCYARICRADGRVSEPITFSCTVSPAP